MFKTNKILDRLNNMLDNAIKGKKIETTFDESKVSKIETKLQAYLTLTGVHKENLQEEKERINTLISDISHQTKIPLTNIILYSELLYECNTPKEQMQYKEIIKQQTNKLQFLIKSLVKMSRLENGIIKTKPKLQNISKLLDSIKHNFPNVTIISSFIDVYYDFYWSLEAIENIIDNAIKYGANKIIIKITPYNLFAKIDIIDNGIGIAEDEIPKIFTRFYRSKQNTEKNGVGIGLYLARDIISKQGGYIKASSQLNKGSIFSIFLPMK